MESHIPTPDSAEVKANDIFAEIDVTGDRVDAYPDFITNIYKKKKEKPKIGVHQHKNDLFYNTNHPRRGIAVIFNHEHFDLPVLKQRNGTEADGHNLEITLRNMHFEVIVHKDLTFKQLDAVLDDVASLDFNNCDCLLIAVLSHGEQNSIYAKNMSYSTNVLFNRFTPDKCPSLAGKPKLFVIQACQGDKLDGGIDVEIDKPDSGAETYRMPLYADFLFAYSTIPGYFSWRNTQRGSWFIQAFCEEFNQHWQNFDFLTILLFVNRRVAYDFESYTKSVISSTTSSKAFQKRQKQLPTEAKKKQLPLNLVVKDKKAPSSTSQSEKTQTKSGKPKPRIHSNICRFCGKFYTTANELKEHEMNHTTNKELLCPECGMGFARRSYLVEHACIHSGEKPHKCYYCDRAFTLKCNLVRHVRIHTGEKPFICDICNKDFTLKKNMIEHKRTHTGEKPFDCKLCDQSFSRRSSLVRHLRIHTGEKCYECHECHKTFSWKYYLQRHMAIHLQKKSRKCRRRSNNKQEDTETVPQPIPPQTDFINCENQLQENFMENQSKNNLVEHSYAMESSPIDEPNFEIKEEIDGIEKMEFEEESVKCEEDEPAGSEPPSVPELKTPIIIIESYSKAIISTSVPQNNPITSPSNDIIHLKEIVFVDCEKPSEDDIEEKFSTMAIDPIDENKSDIEEKDGVPTGSETSLFKRRLTVVLTPFILRVSSLQEVSVTPPQENQTVSQLNEDNNIMTKNEYKNIGGRQLSVRLYRMEESNFPIEIGKKFGN
ncbi:hypothetical protein V9T40_001734 [Parthenolecanium corni]|uniref:Uncharacterized protein n=1 Tax=Parthenolecanium corni TaxID=536013 RepID=A0AAN9TW46_9HEMI